MGLRTEKKIQWLIKKHPVIHAKLLEKPFEVSSKDCQFLDDAIRSMRNYLSEDLLSHVAGFSKIDHEPCRLSIELNQKGMIDPMMQTIRAKKQKKSDDGASTSKRQRS